MAILYEKTFEVDIDTLSGSVYRKTTYTDIVASSTFNDFTQPVCHIRCPQFLGSSPPATLTIPAGMGGNYIFIPMYHDSGSSSYRHKYFKFLDANNNVLHTTATSTSVKCCFLYEIPENTVKIQMWFTANNSVYDGVLLGGIYIITPDVVYSSPMLVESNETKTYDINHVEDVNTFYVQRNSTTSYTSSISVYGKYNDTSLTSAAYTYLGSYLKGVTSVDGIRSDILSKTSVAYEDYYVHNIAMDISNNGKPIKYIKYDMILNHNPLKYKAAFPVISPAVDYTTELNEPFKFKGNGTFDCVLTPEFTQGGDLTGISSMSVTIEAKDGDTVIDSTVCDLLAMSATGSITIPKTYTETDLTLRYVLNVTGSVTETSYADVFLNMSLTVL